MSRVGHGQSPMARAVPSKLRICRAEAVMCGDGGSEVGGRYWVEALRLTHLKNHQCLMPDIRNDYDDVHDDDTLQGEEKYNQFKPSLRPH